MNNLQETQLGQIKDGVHSGAPVGLGETGCPHTCCDAFWPAGGTNTPPLESWGPWVRRESCSTFKRERKSREKTRGWHYPSICLHWYHSKLKPNSWEMLIWQAFGSTAGGNLNWNSPFGTLTKPWRTHGFMNPQFQSWAPTQQKCSPRDTQKRTFKRALRIISPN